MGTKVVKNDSDRTEKVQVNVTVQQDEHKGTGFGKVVMFGAVPGILLGGSAVTAAAYASSDDFDEVVKDMKEAALDILGVDERPSAGTETAAAVETAETVETVETAEEVEDVEEVEEVSYVDIQEEDAIKLPTPLAIADVDDSMSFGEAFAEARSQVGSGGVFEWRGNNYSTFTKEEWDDMNEEERGDYMEDYYNTDMNVEEDDLLDDVDVIAEEDIAASLEGREDMYFEHTEQVETTVAEREVYVDPETEDVVVVEESVTYIDTDTDDVHVVAGTVDGCEVVFADVDGDGVADIMAVDMNGDGVADADEFFCLEDGDVSMDEIGGMDEDMMC